MQRRLQRTGLSGFRGFWAYTAYLDPRSMYNFLAFYGSWAITLPTFAGLGRGGSVGFRV